MDKGNKTGTGRRRSRRAAVRRGQHRRSVILICVVLLCLSGVLAVSSVKLNARNAQYKVQEEELEAQIQEQKERSEDIEAFQEYVKTDDYIKETAEDKLGLVDPDEIIFKPVR